MSLYGATFGKSPVPFAPGAARLAGSMPSGGMMREIDQGQLLASIAATSHDCILSLDAEGQVLWASPATHDVLGWRPEDLAGSDLGVLFPRGSGELRSAAMERLLAGERVEPFVEAGVRRDGSTFKAQLTLGPTHAPDGRITGMIAILRDVTEQLQEQRELALALEMSRAHFDQAATPQAIVDLRGHLESVNPAWCELFGHGEGWFADCDLLDLVHPVEAAAVVDRIERLRSGEIDSISYRGLFRGASGRELTLVLDAALLRGPSGRPYAIAASVEDLDSVTETEQTVASDRGAAEERQRFAEVLARRGWDAVVVLDERLAIRHVDRRVARMLGYQPDDLLHHLSWEYLHSAEAGQVAGLLERL